MTWAIINALSGTIATSLIAYLLGAYGHRFNALERVGFGITGAGMILTVGPILSRHIVPDPSPFDDWSATLLRVGVSISLCGIFARLQGVYPGARLAPPPKEEP